MDLVFILVLEVGLEPTNSEEGRFTVSCDCHYAIPAYMYSIYYIVAKIKILQQGRDT